MSSFRLRTAVPADVDGLVGRWRDAAENAGRPVDTRAAVGALIDRDPDALIVAAEERLLALGARRIDAMVLDRNELGQRLWSSRGYRRQDEWSRWVTSV